MALRNSEPMFHYAPTSIRTIATGITADHLDRLIAEAMEGGDDAGGELLQADDALLQDLVCHQEPSSTHRPPPPCPRTLTARQFNSHKRTKAKRNKVKKQCEAGAEGFVEENCGVVRGREKGRAVLGMGEVDGEGRPAGEIRGKQCKKSKKLKPETAGPKPRVSDRMGAGEGTNAASCLGAKRSAGEERLPPPKRTKTASPPLQPVTSPAKQSFKTARRRHRRQIHTNATKLPGGGYWASDYVRKKVARVASIKRLDYGMGAALERGVQLGAYRPSLETPDERMKRLSVATKEALNEGTEESVRGFLRQLEYQEGYQRFEWDGINPVLLVDTEDRVFAVLVGQPDHESWRNRCKRLFDLMLKDAAKYQALPPGKTDHRRGAYPSVHTGVTYAPGDPKAHNLSLEPKEERLIKDPEQLALRRHIQKFVETAFSLFAPRLYQYYTSHMQKLHSHPLYQSLDYEDPYGGFFCLSVNSGPRVVTLPHRDVMNLAYGWCAVVALGDFKPLLGGHLILHDLRLFFTFPPGSVVLFPSAFLWHSNAPIRKEDQRASITWYSAGCLFRFIDNSFMKQKDLEREFPEEYRRRRKEKDKANTTAGRFYSTIAEILSPLSPSPPSPAPSSPLSSALSSCPSSPILLSLSL